MMMVMLLLVLLVVMVEVVVEEMNVEVVKVETMVMVEGWWMWKERGGSVGVVICLYFSGRR